VGTEQIIVGLDVGTTKVCVLVGEIQADGRLRIIGVGLVPSRGMSRGAVSDIADATEAIRAARHQAERTSGYEISRALVSVAGQHISSINSRGVTGLNANRGVVTQTDVDRALESARAVALPHNREILHIVPRTYMLDGQDGVRNPLGLHAFRLEVEAHIITAAMSSVRNLEKGVKDAGIMVDRFVLNPLASALVTLTDAERESGVAVVDIGGGTTDLAVFIEGTVWHTAIIAVAGNHITSDIAHVLHLPFDEAERIKIEYGHADAAAVDRDALVTVQPFGEDLPAQVLRYDLASVIEARADEIFMLVLQELKRSGYDGLLPAGVVITGGTAALPGIRETARRVMNLPARVAKPENLSGLVDKLDSPAFSTSVGLLYFAVQTGLAETTAPRQQDSKPGITKWIGNVWRKLSSED
jgi:cell division protein FtsA